MMANSDNGELNRSVTAANTSDPNNSLLQKVTKRVSGLIPASFTKWFGQPGDGQQSVVRRRESMDDEDEDNGPTQIQPPKKRAKLPATASPSDAAFAVNSFTVTTSTPLVPPRTNDLRHHLHQPGPSGYVRHLSTVASSTPAPAYDTRHSRSEAAPLTNGDDRSDSGDSTSGCSYHKGSPFNTDRMTLAEPSTAKPLPGTSLNATLNSSRSLFSDQSLQPQRACLSARRPAFNASTFGSPGFVDRTLSTKRAVNSPFYGGRTIYGGAAAYRKRSRLMFPRADPATSASPVAIKPASTEPTGSGACSVNLSKTARRILDTLEHFSSPVLDAKKIPAVQRGAARKTPYARAPPRELLVPSVPDLLKMKLKSRLQESTVQVRKVATSSSSVLNRSEYSLRAADDRPPKHGSKMKSKVVASVRESTAHRHNDTVDVVPLPEVPLPITTLPKFDFSLAPPKPAEKAATPPAAKPRARPAEYTFASPIVVRPAPSGPVPGKPYTFSEPLDATHTPAPVTFKAASVCTAPRRKDPAKNNGQRNSSVPFGLEPPAHFASGSVMDVLGQPAPKPATSTKIPPPASLMDRFKSAIDTWECTACLVRNLPTAARCVACGAAKDAPPATGFGGRFKLAADRWECGVCLVRNSTADGACAACTTPRAGAPAPAAAPAGFGAQFKPAAGSWECDACLVRNKAGAARCVACETPRPGTAKATAPLQAGFGELLQRQRSNWECQSCMVRNPPDKAQCMCCDTPKPGAPTKPAGLPFKFGVEKAATNATAAGFKFGVDAAATNTAAPSGFKFGGEKTATNTAAPSGFKFGGEKTATNTAAPSGFKFGGEKATEATTFRFGVEPANSSTVSAASSGFTFGVPAKPLDAQPASEVEAPGAVPAVAGSSSKSAGEAPKSFAFSSPAASSAATTTSAATPTTTAAPTFSFSPASSSTTPSSAVPTFAFTAATPTATSPAVTPAKSASFSAPATSIFGPGTGTPATTATVAASTTAFGSVAKAAATTAATSSTFSFTAAGKAVSFGSENSLPLPQFNFGAASVPFSPAAPAPVTSTPVTTASVSFGAAGQTFTFNTVAPNVTVTNNSSSSSKAAAKQFPFAAAEPAAKGATFSFAGSDATKPAPAASAAAKAPVFNFGAPISTKPGTGFSSSAAASSEAGGLFGFTAAARRTQEPPAAWGVAAGAPAGPQNGGFNFGATPSPAPSFSFSSAAAGNQAASAGVFGFGASNQAGSGSASSAGLFSFGGGAAPAAPQQQQGPAFAPDIKPNFNFTSGAVPSFTAQGQSAAPGPMVQRKIRKAVRRTQQR